jgi:hypothetical protein
MNRLSTFLRKRGYTVPFQSIRQGPWTRDGPAEILVSATPQGCRDLPKISAVERRRRRKKLYIGDIIVKMNSTHHENRRDNRDISAF